MRHLFDIAAGFVVVGIIILIGMMLGKTLATPYHPPKGQLVLQCEPEDVILSEAPVENWMVPAQDGTSVSLYCRGDNVTTVGCQPDECYMPFFHVSLDVETQVRWAACRMTVDPALIAAVIHVESRGKVGAVSSAGARGLMQIMPATARYLAARLGITYYDGIEFNPKWSVMMGATYLEELLRRYDGDTELALTAYNRGPTNTDHILGKYGKLPVEVLGYAKLVQAERSRYHNGK